MLADRTNTYENKADKSQLEQKMKKIPIDLQYQSQTYEKTKSIIGEELEKSFEGDLENEENEVQKSLCLQESEIQRLSQAYADKYYYEMKFEQYQNLLASQQNTIGKLLNEKKELLSQLEKQELDNKNIQTDEDELLKSYMERDERQREIIQQLTQQNELLLQKSNQKELFSEITKQMNEIKQQNNYLFEQLKIKEQQLEQEGITQREDRYVQEKVEMQEEFEQQIEMKDETIHQQEMEITQLNSQLQQLYSDNLQLQNQLDILNANYQEDIQQQANLLQQQVAEYKIVINNLENQLFLMNAEIQRRGRSNSKDGRLISNYIKYNYPKANNDIGYNSITPSGKKN